MKTKAREREMKGRRKNPIVVEPSPALLNTLLQQLYHILVHWMRQWSFFFAIVIVHTSLQNSKEDADTCVTRVIIFYQFINISIRWITKKSSRSYHYYKKKPMAQRQKHPQKSSFKFKKSKVNNVILLDKNNAKTYPFLQGLFFIEHPRL
jgi:hypothetical protein